MVDFNLYEGDDTINSDVDLVMQQIDILFDTKPGDVYGESTFGTYYDKYLYDLKLSPEQLKERMEMDLNSIDLMGFRPSIEVYLMQGTERDIALIQVDLYKNTKTYSKAYKIT